MSDWSAVRCLSGVKLGKSEFNSKEELGALLLARDQKRSRGRKTGVFHPSSFGKSCRRAVFYERTGHEGTRIVHRADDLFMFAQGHALHDIIQDAFNSIDDFLVEVPVENEALQIYGHCDGLFYKEQWVLEIKTIGDASYKVLLKPQKAHLLQAHCYMYCLDVPRVQLLYVNRNTLQTRCFRVGFDPDVWSTILEVINYIEDYIAKGEEPPREESKYHCRRCKFVAICNPECLKA